MRSIEQLSLYAYGLLDPAEEEEMEHHVKDCATCEDVVRRLRVEQGVLRQAASRGEAPEAPRELLERRIDRPRASFRLAALAAAALLGVLVWFLSRPFDGGKDLEFSPVTQSGGEELDRLIGELKSSSTLRREIAALALEAYGSAALEKLEKAGADPVLLDSCRGITRADRAVLTKLKEFRITIDIQNSPLTAIIDYMRETSGLNFHLSGVPNPESQMISYKVENIVLDGALRLLLQPRSLAYRVKGGVVVITPSAEAEAQDSALPPAKSPVRIPKDDAAIRRQVTALSAGSPQERDRASQKLARLGFAAERILWDSLDSKEPEVLARSAALLRQLYTAREPRPASPADRALEETKVTASFENAPLSEIFAYLGDTLRVPILIAPSVEKLDLKVTFKVADLTGKNTLKLLLSQIGADYPVLDGVLLIVDSHEPVFRTPEASLWASPEEAKGIETRLLRIAAGEKVDLPGECGPGDIPALLQALRALEGAPSERCRLAAAVLAEQAHGWVLDLPSGADLQPLTDRQSKILSTECKPAADETLDAFFLRSHLKGSVKAAANGLLRTYGPGLPLRSFLKALTRTSGRDFYLEGETIVVDTAAAVRARVEK